MPGCHDVHAHGGANWASLSVVQFLPPLKPGDMEGYQVNGEGHVV